MNPQRVCGSGRATPSLHHTLSDMHKDIINQYDAIWHKLRGARIIAKCSLSDPKNPEGVA